jgi:phytol kinase
MFIAKVSGVLLFLTVVLLLIYVFGKQCHLHLEIQRKLLHIALGVASLSFPFLFETTAEVVLLVIIALAVLLSLHYIPILRRTLGESIYGVKRSWLGGGLFLVSIITLFFLAKDNYTLYAGPLLLVTFADAFAAIVGSKYGKKYYTIFGSNKSLEGTFTFFVTGFISIALLLTLTTFYAPISIIFIAVWVAVLTTVAELFAGKAFDNITVPGATFAVLQYFL